MLLCPPHLANTLIADDVTVTGAPNTTVQSQVIAGVLATFATVIVIVHNGRLLYSDLAIQKVQELTMTILLCFMTTLTHNQNLVCHHQPCLI